jgi:hypothetical protein
MINKRIAIDFMVIATVNDIINYIDGFFITKNNLWFYDIVDFSTMESRSSLLITIIAKNTYVVGLLFLKYLHKVLNVSDPES